MGEAADAALDWASRNMRDPLTPRPSGRNPVAAYCPHCGKGIRRIAGEIRESMAMHIKAKHPEVMRDNEEGDSRG